MRKNIIVIILVIVVTLLFGCASENKEQHNEKKLQQVKFYGIMFQLPLAWEKYYSEEDVVSYVEKDGKEIINMFTIEKENIEMTANEYAGEIFDNLQRGEFNIYDVKRSQKVLHDTKTEIMTYISVVEDKKLSNIIMLIPLEEYIISIDFSSVDYTDINDFNDVIDSISFVN